MRKITTSFLLISKLIDTDLNLRNLFAAKGLSFVFLIRKFILITKHRYKLRFQRPSCITVLREWMYFDSWLQVELACVLHTNTLVCCVLSHARFHYSKINTLSVFACSRFIVQQRTVYCFKCVTQNKSISSLMCDLQWWTKFLGTLV